MGFIEADDTGAEFTFVRQHDRDLRSSRHHMGVGDNQPAGIIDDPAANAGDLPLHGNVAKEVKETESRIPSHILHFGYVDTNNG